MSDQQQPLNIFGFPLELMTLGSDPAMTGTVVGILYQVLMGNSILTKACARIMNVSTAEVVGDLDLIQEQADQIVAYVETTQGPTVAEGCKLVLDAHVEMLRRVSQDSPLPPSKQLPKSPRGER